MDNRQAGEGKLLCPRPALELEFAAHGFGQVEWSFHVYELYRRVIMGEFCPLTGLMKSDPPTNILGAADVGGSFRTHEDVNEQAAWKHGRRVDCRKVGVHVDIPKNESSEPFDFAQGTR